MEMIRTVLAGLCAMVTLAALAEMLIPAGSLKQGARFVIGVMMLSMLSAPLMALLG